MLPIEPADQLANSAGAQSTDASPLSVEQVNMVAPVREHPATARPRKHIPETPGNCPPFPEWVTGRKTQQMESRTRENCDIRAIADKPVNIELKSPFPDKIA
jgi:hypothetical protein